MASLGTIRKHSSSTSASTMVRLTRLGTASTTSCPPRVMASQHLLKSRPTRRMCQKATSLLPTHRPPSARPLPLPPALCRRSTKTEEPRPPSGKRSRKAVSPKTAAVSSLLKVLSLPHPLSRSKSRFRSLMRLPQMLSRPASRQLG